MGVAAATTTAVLPQVLGEGLELIEAGGIADGRTLSGRRQQASLSQISEVMAEGRGGHAEVGLDLPSWGSFYRPLHYGPDNREATWMGHGLQLFGDVDESGIGVAHDSIILNFLN